ncbi:MAG: hypothetical protein PWQ23_1498 [Thermoanaerobacter sp.]|nr:hypothetical protein [Thermoanaerobacter sp.]
MSEIIRPKYEYIAFDIAKRIVDGEFNEDERLYGRSNLAGLYKVSPETIRRAISLLQDMGVVVSEQGKGVIVKSKEAAQRYINQFNEKQTLEVLKNELAKIAEGRKKLDERLETILLKFIEYANRLKNISDFNPVEIRVNEKSTAVGKTLAELKFWDVTGATVIAIRRGEEVIISPGPNEQIKGGDYLVLVGSKEAFKKSISLVDNYTVISFP